MVPEQRIELWIDAYKATVMPFNYTGVIDLRTATNMHCIGRVRHLSSYHYDDRGANVLDE